MRRFTPGSPACATTVTNCPAWQAHSPTPKSLSSRGSSGNRNRATVQCSDARKNDNPFSEGATLNRESSVLDLPVSSRCRTWRNKPAAQVCLNNNDISQCINRAIDDGSSYYELTYYPADRNWHGEFRKVSVKTRRVGVQLAYRAGYFARVSDSNISANEPKDTDTRVMHAVCKRFPERDIDPYVRQGGSG